MLDSIYHMTNTSKTLSFCHHVRNVVMDVIMFPLVVYRFYCMALFHSQTRRHMIIYYFVQSKPLHAKYLVKYCFMTYAVPKNSYYSFT